MEAPTLHAIAAIAVALATFWLYARSTIRIEIISLLLIAVLALLLFLFPIPGSETRSGFDIAFGGFSHEALIAICCLMIMGRGLVATGALEPAARTLTRIWRITPSLGLLLTISGAALMSMFVNDTPVLVLLLPLLLNVAARTGSSPSKTLMPVNCAILLGGMATTIGTSTNLLVVSIAADMEVPPFGVFDFTGIAITAGLVAVPYLWLVMPRLLPDNGVATDISARVYSGALYVTAEMLEARGGAIAPTREFLQEHHVRLNMIVGPLGGRHASGASLAVGDILRVAGTRDHLTEVSAAIKAPLASPAVLEMLQALNRKNAGDQVLAELVIGADSTLIDETVGGAQIADRYGVAIIGVHRSDHARSHLVSLLRDERFQIGDVLLVQGTKESLGKLQLAEGAHVLEGAAEMPRSFLAPVALAIFASTVAAAALHLLPIAIAALAGAIAMLATGCIRFERLGRALSGEVIVLVAASIALGRALLETGAAEWLGSLLALVLQAAPPAGVLAAVMAFSAILTNFSSNTAAAAVGTPIAVSLAQQTGAPPEPLVLAVLFGCNLCFATPIAYQTNILIMSAGRYRFSDYFRAGLPLVLLMIITLSFLLAAKYAL